MDNAPHHYRHSLATTALLPVFRSNTAEVLQRALDAGGAKLEAVIVEQHLAPLWHEATRATTFAAHRLDATFTYLKQKAAIQEIDDLFERAGIRYAVIKGAASRELTYDDPAVRTCGDIDILVAPDQRVEAARVLVESGYRLNVNPEVASHEVALCKRMVWIDLHWDIVRPGRVPRAVVDGLLERRQRHDGRWILLDADALFLMLVHAAISKHVSTSGLGLHRVADLASWWLRRDVDWLVVRSRLDQCGLKAAAWTVLTWVQMVSHSSELDAVLDTPITSVRQGRLRSAYLRAWLDHDLPARLTRQHALRLLGFSLFMHDDADGAWHALKGRRSAKTAASADADAFGDLLIDSAARHALAQPD